MPNNTHECVSRAPRWHVMLPGVAFGIAALLMAAHSEMMQPWKVDDAYISFRYAENFAEGKGLVYNAGERVEGYTTFLWVLLLGIGRALGGNTVILSEIYGVTFTLATFLLLANSHRFLRGVPPLASAIGTVFVACTGMISLYSMGGMEVPLAAFLVTLAVLLYYRGREPEARLEWTWGAAVVCVLATMTRPECGLLFLVLFADRLAVSVVRRDWRFFYFGFVFTVIYLPYFLWRWDFYGHLLPNTFYAKVGDRLDQVARGYQFVAWFVRAEFLLLVPAVMAMLAGRNGYRRYVPFTAVAVIIALQFVYVVAVGGDSLPGFRFFAPYMPLIALISALGCVAFIREPVRLAVVVLAIGVFTAVQVRAEPLLRGGGTVGTHGKEVGLWLRETVPPDTLIATNTAGSIPYWSGLPTVDMLGLNDETIAHREIPNMGRGLAGHEKGDGRYVLSRKPDIIQFGSALGTVHPRFRGDGEINSSPEFKRNYRLRSFRLPSGKQVRFYVRNDFKGFD